jgi:hypothetical protein
MSALDPINPNFPYAPNSRKTSLTAGDAVFDTDLHALFSPSESVPAGRVSTDALAQLRLQQRRLPPPQPQAAAPGSLSFSAAPAALSPAANQADLVGPFEFSPQHWGSDLDFWETVSVPDQMLTGNVDVPVDPLAMDMGGMGYGWDGSLAGLNWGDGSGSVDLFNGFFFGGASGSGGVNEGGL